MIYRILSTEQQKILETKRQFDFSYSLPGVARFRVNTYFQRTSIGAAFRMIPTRIRTLEELALPTRLYEFGDMPRGLVLVTGPTGSGKSTTLASLIDRINRTRSEHILTIEDPIEFLHHHQRCIVNQREIGEDATTFAEGLRAALRQDPDVILVGEMRDLETISTALTAAETGHLVFATLHTQSAPQTIDRVIDAFPATQQQQVRVQLAATLQGVVTQNLVPTADGHGRTAALEILMPDDAVRNLIRQAKIEQVYSVMQTSTVARNADDGAVAGRPDAAPGHHIRGCVHADDARRPAARSARARRLQRLPRSCPSDQRPAPGRRGVNMNLKKEIKLSNLVPKPKRSELVGLKIGASQLAASRVANNGSARVLQLARQHLPAGIVVAGDVRDIPALAAALDEFFRTNKLPRRGVRLGVATNRIGVRAFDLDGIEDERQLENAIRFRAHEAIAIPVDDAVIDYRVVRESKDENGASSRRIVLAAAYRESLDRYVAACKAADIELVGIDLEAFALLRAVAPPVLGDVESPAAVVAVTVGHDRTTLAISDGVVCDFMRVLEWGGSTLTTAIERDTGVTSTEAAELKLGLSLDADDVSEGEDEKVTRARDAVRRELQNLARELVSSLQFYQAQPGSLAIAEILLAGGTSRLTGLAEELERLTRVSVRRADPLVRAQVADSVQTGDDLPSLAVAIGLGIED